MSGDYDMGADDMMDGAGDVAAQAAAVAEALAEGLDVADLVSLSGGARRASGDSPGSG